MPAPKNPSSKQSSASSGKTLIIVESPSKAKTINKILGNAYRVAASVGHIVDLPQHDLGIDIDDDFRPDYTVIDGKADVVKRLKNAAAAADKILLATDPDREGEAIAHHIAEILQNINPNIRRIEFNAITENAIQSALAAPREVSAPRVHSQQARRVLDRLVGYMVSPLLWKSLHKGLSAGRVQSVALRLLCEREEEIENFTPVEFWKLSARLESASGEAFIARLIQIGADKLDPHKFRISSEKEAEGHLKTLQKEIFRVDKVKNRKADKKPLPPFVTSTLQQDAARRFNISTADVMKSAQKLYEGFDLGKKGTVGLITYMRSDSTRISDEALAAVRHYIADTVGTDYLPAKPVIYKSKGAAQDAHEAIRPTHLTRDFEPRMLRKLLPKREYQLYELIWRRFVACQMKPAQVLRRSIDITAGIYRFRASGETILFQGYLKVYQPPAEGADEANGDNDGEAAQRLPERIAEGELLKLLELLKEQSFTRPPPRYTESALVKILDKLGIGRPSTYSQIIATLLNRRYAVKEKRTLQPTVLGRTVCGILLQHFPDLFNVKFTAEMEGRLDIIEVGKLSYLETLQSFYGPFKMTLDAAEGKITPVVEAPEVDCSDCGKPMRVRWGRKGPFLGCSGYPDCSNTRPINMPSSEGAKGERCEKCDSPMVVRRGQYGEFLACSNYPKCKHTSPISTGVACPQDNCKGRMVERRSRKGTVFFGCSAYPACNYVLWNRPVQEICANCKFPLQEEIVSDANELIRQCPNCRNRVKVD